MEKVNETNNIVVNLDEISLHSENLEKIESMKLSELKQELWRPKLKMSETKELQERLRAVIMLKIGGTWSR